MKASKNRKIANRAKDVFYNSKDYQEYKTSIDIILSVIDEQASKGYFSHTLQYYLKEETYEELRYVNTLMNTLLHEGYTIQPVTYYLPELLIKDDKRIMIDLYVQWN